MTRHETDPASPEERAAQDAVRRLPARPLDPGFRHRLGELFVSGSLEGTRPDSGALDPDQVAAPAPAPAPVTRWLRPAAWTLAAAAALWLIVSFWSAGPDPQWEVVATEGVGTVWVNGVAHQSPDLSRAGLLPGVDIRTDGSVSLELTQQGFYALELSPGSDFTLPEPANGRLDVASVREGIATWVTGPSFPGRRLRIDAPDAQVWVVGTTFAVLADDEKTCISVLEGEVGVGTGDGELRSVAAGRCRRIYRTPQVAPTESNLDDGQIASLTQWHARSRDLLPGQ